MQGEVGLALVVAPGWVSHLGMDRETPEIRAFQDALNPAGRTLFLDKRGSGHSDRPTGPEHYTLDARVDDLRRVLDGARPVGPYPPGPAPPRGGAPGAGRRAMPDRRYATTIR